MTRKQPKTPLRSRKNAKEAVRARRSSDPDPFSTLGNDYDIVALRVPLGTATFQARMAWLDGRDMPQMAKIRRDLFEHVAKCLNEAIEEAKRRWGKVNRR